ncbi:MAG: MarR family transcriptional regulator [Hyphomicrobiaceae bacterium]|nr:MarR family transcriptional regulator [Hyphomicrobiaceae bacterium]
MVEQRDEDEVGVEGGSEVNLAALDQATGYLLRRAQMWLFRELKARFKPFDISIAQYTVLYVVSINPGLAQARVAEALLIERARLVLMLDRLEERGLIVRTRSKSDRRSHELHITDGGRELLDKLLEVHNEHESRIEGMLGADGKAALLKLLTPFQ